MPPSFNNPQRHHGITIPPTSVEVIVHDVEDPHFIQISEVKSSDRMLQVINAKLRGIAKKISREKRNSDHEKLEIGTVAIVRRGASDVVDLPAWYCRAILAAFDESTSKYSMFLPDYGDTVEVLRQSFLVGSQDILSIPFVTFPVGLNEILPLERRRSENKRKYEWVAQAKWCPESIDLVRQLTSSSSRCYFDELTMKENIGMKFGELYLVIDNQVVSLSKALIVAKFAVKLSDILDNENSTDSRPPVSDKDEEIEDEYKSPNDLENPQITTAKRNIFHEILVCSNIECERLIDIKEARFDSTVLSALDQIHIKSLRRIQSYTWPAINKGLDVLAVGPSKAGKTIGYAAPISSIIAHNKQYQVDSSYPMALVLCGSSREGLHIENIFKELLIAHTDIKVVGAFNGCTDRAIIAKIYSGCHIFISTPAFLLRFLEKNDSNRQLLKLDYINHLVIDNLDVLLEKHKQSLTHLLTKYMLIRKKNARNSNILALQIVAAAQHWTGNIRQFIQILKNPYICIGSFAEAAIFSGVQLRPRLVLGDQKITKLAEILENHYRMVKTIIVCADNKEVEELYEFLATNFQVLYVHNKMDYMEIHGIKEKWSSSVAGEYQLLICTDIDLTMLEITDATWLIHYSIAVPTKSTFLFRFSTLMKNLKSNSTKCEVTIFIDDTNDTQFRGIMDLIKRSGYVLSKHQLATVEKIRMTLERQKKGHPICNDIKALGQCRNSSKCLYRHCVLEDVDAPMTSVRVDDRLILTITYVHNATHFSARILEYIDGNNEKHELSEIEHIKIVNKVHNYFSVRHNRRMCREVKIGEIYAFEESFDQYQRVKIINISTKDAEDNPEIVDLRFIDTGNVAKNIKVNRLRQMPKDLAETPAHIVEIFLTNVSPFDSENEWSLQANAAVIEWFSKQLKPSATFLQGKVCLHLGDTLWVDPLEIRTKITGRQEIVSDTLTHYLLKSEHGMKNPAHLKLLRQLCVNAGMTFDEVDL